MEDLNGNVQNKKVLFSIGTYSEAPKRVINKIPKPEIFTSAENSSNSTAASVQLRNSHANSLPRDVSKSLFRGRPASLDITDSSRTRTLPSSLKVSAQNGRSVSEIIDKPMCPPSSPAVACAANGLDIDKPDYPPGTATNYNRSVSLEPEQLRNTGKVALTIAAYEGEPRTPTRLDFLPSNRLSRSSSKASSSTASTPIDQLDQVLNSHQASGGEPIGMQLQNELVATLKRSNLKKINDAVENGTIDSVEKLEENNEKESELHVVTKESSKEADACCLMPKETDKSMEKSKETNAYPLNPKETNESSEEAKESDACCIKPKEINEISETKKITESMEESKKHNQNFETTVIIENVEKPKEKNVNFEEPKEVSESSEKTELTNGNLDEIKEVAEPSDEIEEVSATYSEEIKELDETLETLKELSENAGEPNESNETPNGSVKQLAVELGKNLKLYVNPENGESTICEKKSSD